MLEMKRFSLFVDGELTRVALSASASARQRNTKGRKPKLTRAYLPFLKAFFPSLHLGRLSTQHLIVQLDARLMNSL
jgi:hypothetical protein